jgi:hypothetical protein
VVRIALPDGRIAFGRVLRDASIAIYRGIWNGNDRPPIGSRDFAFVVGIYDADLRALPVAGSDPASGDDDWPPPMAIRPVLSGDHWKIYDRGVMRQSSAEGARSLEPAAVWHIDHIIDRVLGDRRWG